MSTKIKYSNCDLTFIVDDKHASRMQLYTWYYDKINNLIYRTEDGMPIGRVVLNCYDSKLEVDHISGNRHDNQESNLRIGTHAQNMYNQRKPKGNFSSKYKGVSWHTASKKWQAYIRVNYQRIHLGLFVTEIEAALAYDEAAKKYFGEFARLNFPEKGSK